jgi:hypothetical protein
MDHENDMNGMVAGAAFAKRQTTSMQDSNALAGQAAL